MDYTAKHVSYYNNVMLYYLLANSSVSRTGRLATEADANSAFRHLQTVTFRAVLQNDGNLLLLSTLMPRARLARALHTR